MKEIKNKILSPFFLIARIRLRFYMQRNIRTFN